MRYGGEVGGIGLGEQPVAGAEQRRLPDVVGVLEGHDATE